MPLEVLTVEGLDDQAEIAGFAMFVAAPAEGPSEGKASSELASTGAGAEEPDPFTLEAEEADLGAGQLLDKVGKGSGAPSSPCR